MLKRQHYQEEIQNKILFTHFVTFGVISPTNSFIIKSNNDNFSLLYNYGIFLIFFRRNPDFKRISRILLAIKELGHIDLMRPWMIFLADLIYKEKELEQASESFLQFWIETLDAEDKIFLTHYVEQFNL